MMHASAKIKSAGAQALASNYREEHQKDVVNRLRRIEGQVRGLVEMIESGRPCEDIAQQLSAARKAMDKTFYRLVACSVIEAVSESKNEAQAISQVERAAKILEKFA